MAPPGGEGSIIIFSGGLCFVHGGAKETGPWSCRLARTFEIRALALVTVGFALHCFALLCLGVGFLWCMLRSFALLCFALLCVAFLCGCSLMCLSLLCFGLV